MKIAALSISIALLPLVLHASDYDTSMNVLDWSEEFNYTGLPQDNNWDYEVGYIRNNELQKYTKADSNNVNVENGCLVITAKKDDSGNVTSASLITLNKRHFFRGRIEVRAKVPTGNGTWPAIWAMGIDRTKVGWPKCGEIDIMEYVGYTPYVFHNNVHTLGSKTTDKGAMTTGKQTTVSNAYADFHVFALERTDTHIKFFIDEKLVFDYKKNDTHPDYWYGMNQPHYLLLNLAIGGSWSGTKGVDDSIFPAKYYVDYVRFYVAADAPRKYVSKSGNDLNDGNSWATAYATVAQAISYCDCSSNGEVWIAESEYPEATPINMRDNLTIYGGFKGDETTLEQRNGGATIISGSNKQRIFYNKQLSSTAKLDRITITKGKADMGGGIYNTEKSAPIFTDCTFTQNTADTNGGGVFNNNATPQFFNCKFYENTATANGGGAVYNNYFSQVYYKNCTFDKNYALKGAGAYNSHQVLTTFLDCVFANNKTFSNGTGGAFQAAGQSDITVKNSLFLNNTSDRGGAVFISYSKSDFINCTFQNNYAIGAPAVLLANSSAKLINTTVADNTGEWGGAAYAQESSSLKVANCIFWNNTGTYVSQVSNDETSSKVLANSIIQGGGEGTNIISANPLLKDLSDNGGITQNRAVRSDSPAIGLGSNAVMLQDCTPPDSDARGKSRATPCTVGAYEFIKPQSYTVWAQENLSTAQNQSPTQKNFNDNITNLQRYAQAIDNQNLSTTAQPLTSPQSVPCKVKFENTPTIQYRISRSANDISIIPMYSFDMLNWLPLSPQLSNDTLPDAQIMKASSPNVNNKQTFFKLQITTK